MQIQFKRGQQTNISNLSLAEGEPAITLDTGEFYVGIDGSNKLINPAPDTTLTQSGVPADAKTVGDILADLMYEPISIEMFTNNVNTVEMGQTVTDVTLSWSYNKTPTTAKLDGTLIDVSATSKSLTGQTITSNKTYTLAVTDERDASANKTTSISFLNGVYWGVALDSTLNSAFILALNKGLQSNRSKTFTVNAGVGQYIYYACPARYGACKFNVGGFDGGFSLVSTISFKNASGYTEDYYVYKSDNANLGSTTVKVS